MDIKRNITTNVDTFLEDRDPLQGSEDGKDATSVCERPDVDVGGCAVDVNDDTNEKVDTWNRKQDGALPEPDAESNWASKEDNSAPNAHCAAAGDQQTGAGACHQGEEVRESEGKGENPSSSGSGAEDGWESECESSASANTSIWSNALAEGTNGDGPELGVAVGEGVTSDIQGETDNWSVLSSQDELPKVRATDEDVLLAPWKLLSDYEGLSVIPHMMSHLRKPATKNFLVDYSSEAGFYMGNLMLLRDLLKNGKLRSRDYILKYLNRVIATGQDFEFHTPYSVIMADNMWRRHSRFYDMRSSDITDQDYRNMLIPKGREVDKKNDLCTICLEYNNANFRHFKMGCTRGHDCAYAHICFKCLGYHPGYVCRTRRDIKQKVKASKREAAEKFSVSYKF